MSSFFSSDLFAPGTEVQVSRFNPEEIFPYTTYYKVKPLFPVPQIRKRFMLVTNAQVVDMTVHSFKVSLATVTDVHAMSDLLKVKYKKGEVISLTFVGDKIQQYGMKDTERCLQYIRLKMSENGVKANMVTNRYKKNIATAQGLLDTIRELESDFAEEPSYELVITVMEVLRDAVELFGEANDSRYLRALDHIQAFLQRPDVIEILDTMSPDKREGNEADGMESSEHSDVPSTASSIHISQRLSKKVGAMLSKSPQGSPTARSAASPSEDASVSSPSSAMSAPVLINMPPVAASEDTTGEPMRRKLSSGSGAEGGRPRVQSKARRRSMRTQSLENAQFMTMDSLHFDDAEDALWVEDEEGREVSEDIDSAYDIVDDENIALLDSMIGNMTHELEGIIGDSLDLEDMPESPISHRRNGSNELGLGFALTRGLSSLDVNEEL